MITVGKLAFRNAILCEDIRQEKSEKFILIGVFSGDILVANIPATVALAFYFDAEVLSDDPGKLWLKLSGPGKHEAQFEVNVAEAKMGDPASITFGGLSVLMTCEGTFRVLASADQETWVPLIEKKVNQRDGLWSLTPIELPPPSAQPLIGALDSSSQP